MYWWYIDYISIKLSLRNRKNKITHTGFWAVSPLSTSVEALLFQSLHPPSLDFLQLPQRLRLPARVLCLSIQKHLPSCCAGGWKPWNSGPGSTYLSVFKGEPGSQCEGRVKRRDFCLGRAPRSSTQVWIHCLILVSVSFSLKWSIRITMLWVVTISWK